MSIALAPLIHNAAMLLAMMVIFDLITRQRSMDGLWQRKVVAGLLLGGLSIGLMMASFQLETGIVFDTRSVLLSLSGLFLGPIPTGIAMGISAIYRFVLDGAGVLPGIGTIVVTGGIGMLWRYFRRHRVADISILELYGFGLVVHLAMLAVMLLLPWEVAMRVLGAISWPVLLVYPVATVALGLLLASRSQHDEATHALKESERRFRRAISGAPFPIMIHAENGEVITVNTAWTRLTGYEHDDIPTIAEWTHKAYGERQDPVREYIDSLYALDGPKAEGVYMVKTRYGDTRAWDFSSAPIGTMENGRRLVISMAMDVTRRMQAESEREKIEEQLIQSRKMESVGRLAGGLAHDFNNFLTIIIGHTEMMLDQKSPDQPDHKGLTEIRNAAERSADLTRQLLVFARKQTVSPRVVDLNEAIASLLKMMKRLIGEDIDLVWTPESGLVPVRIDPSQIDQVVANLCINARDAIPNTGTIMIETHHVTIDDDFCLDHAEAEPGRYARLTVSDNGSGMDKDMLPLIFEPFFTTKELGRGTGLGLATVYGIVKQNKGFITVYSEPGEGTTFKIYLPSHEAASVEHSESSPDTLQYGDETILLVDDDESILNVTTSLLKKLGYTVLAAPDPNEAMRLARENIGHIDLIMTDVIMPDMNGRDLVDHLQSLYPQVKALFMSGYTSNVIAHRGDLKEDVHFLPKPFSMSTLSQKLREVLDN